MTTFLIAIRTSVVIVVLAWLGFSQSPDNDQDKKEQPSGSYLTSIIG